MLREREQSEKACTMITDRVISNCIEEVKEIAGIDIEVFDHLGQKIAGTSSVLSEDTAAIGSFINDADDLRFAKGSVSVKIKDGEDLAYVLVSNETGDEGVRTRLAALQLKNLVAAYRDKVDRNSFYQNLLLDNLLDVDIYNKARKHHIDPAQRRCVFIIEPMGKKDSGLIDMVRELFFTEAGDHVTAVDEDHVVVIKALAPNDDENDLLETANMLVDAAGSEAMSDVRVAYGTITDDIKTVPVSYREARTALEIGRIFYPRKNCIEYGNLGVGRLIYQLPVDLCRLFVREIFGDEIPEEIDEEMLTTVNKFFENSLNVSETSRQLFIHRNTLIYRIEKLQKATGLDVRVFDDALTLKIALMVVKYLNLFPEAPHA